MPASAPPGRQEISSQGKQAASAVANLKPEGLWNMGRVLAHWINHELASKSGLKREPGVKSRPGPATTKVPDAGWPGRSGDLAINHSVTVNYYY
jgi:hypothetical protein